MKNQIEIQKRFLEEDARMRLGHLASDLARIASLVQVQAKEETVKSVIEEGKFFAEWAAQGVELEIQIFLAEIQSFLARTELEWETLSKDTPWRVKIAERTRNWSEELLRKSGFFNSDEQD